MRLLWVVVIGGGVLWLYGRRHRPGRTRAEIAAGELAQEFVNAFGVALHGVAEGGRQIWDDAYTLTGAPVMDGAKGAAVLSPSGTELVLPLELQRSIEPVPR